MLNNASDGMGFSCYVDGIAPSMSLVRIQNSGGASGWEFFEFDSVGYPHNQIDYKGNLVQNTPNVLTIQTKSGAINTFNISTRIYTFSDGEPNRWQTPTIDPGPPPPPPVTDYVVNQTLDPNLTSRSVKTHSDGTAEVLSKLTSVLGTQGQIEVTSTEGQVQIGLAPNLALETLTVNGDVAVHGSLSVDNTFTASQLAATTEVTAPTLTATTEVTAPTVTATGAVNAAYLMLQNYPDETQIPLTVPPGALVCVNNIVGTRV